MSPRAARVLESETNPEDTEIAEGEIDATRTSIVGHKVLWTQDKQDKKWDVILDRLGRSLCECSIVGD